MTEIFVFGSNLAGRHGAGSAREAMRKHGANYGQGFGLQGESFAIPTKDYMLRTMPLHQIDAYVKRFIQFARAHPELMFRLVAIGCGLAGYTPAQIAPMFGMAPRNVILPPEFTEYFDEAACSDPDNPPLTEEQLSKMKRRHP